MGRDPDPRPHRSRPTASCTCSAPPVGGLFRHVVDLARLQAAAGHAVGIVCDSTTGGARAEQALADLASCLSLGVVRLPMQRNPHPSDRVAIRAVT